MRLTHSAILCVLLFAALACSPQANAEPLKAPSGPPPYPGRVILQGDTLYEQQVAFKEVMETRQREVDVNGKKEKQAYVVKRLVAEYYVQPLPKDACRVFTVGGKRLTDAEAAALLAKEKEVLISDGGKLIDPRYQPLFNPGALVVYVKPEQMLGYAAEPPPYVESDAAEPAPEPEFSKSPPPKGMMAGIGFLQKTGNDLILTEFDWEPIQEQKQWAQQIEGPDGKPATVMKMAVQIHWVPTPRERKFKLGELKTLNAAGMPTHGFVGALSEDPVVVLLHDAKEAFDPAHLTLCRPEVVVVQGDFPMRGYYASYTAPPAPRECFASVKDGEVLVREAFPMIEAPMFGGGPEAASSLLRLPNTFVAHVDVHHVAYPQVTTKFKTQSHSLEKVKAVTAAGKAMDVKTLTTRLAKETPVLIAFGRARVDPIYLQHVKPDTIILSLPQPVAPTIGPAPLPLPEPAARPGAAPPTSDEVQARPGGSKFEFVAAQVPAPAPQAGPADPAGPDPASGPAPRFVKIQGLGDKLVLREPIPTTVYAAPAPPPAAAEAAPPAVEAAPPAEGAPMLQEAAAWNSQVIAAGNFRLFTLDGKALDEAAAQQRLAQPIIALLSDHGKKVDPAWLSIYAPETVLVYVKPEARQGGYGHGMMMSPPEAVPAEGPRAPVTKRPLRMATPEELNELLAAAAKADDARVTQLLNDGLNINEQSADGETALMRAAASGHNGYVETLIVEHQADPSLRNKAGKTADQIARENGHDATADAIAKHQK